VNLKPNLNYIGLTIAILSIGVLSSTIALAADKSTAKNAELPVFAQVGKEIITQREYDAAYANASRTRFYHGKPPEGEVATLQREIGDKLVNDILLLNEAKRLKIKPDAEVVKQQVDKIEQRNAGKAQWQKIRERALPVLTKGIEDESMRKQLEQRTRKVPEPNEKQLREYFNSHPEKFTEPQQLRVSIILLGVDPGATSTEYDAKYKQAVELVKQLREGADFSEMATKYSTDAESAGQGGDMGYQHAGMLSELSEQVLSKLKPGEISDPTRLMEGIGIYKLTDRKEAMLNNFDEVKERATSLYLADAGDRAWTDLIAKLRKKTPIKVDVSHHYLPLPNNAGTNTNESPSQPGTMTTGDTSTTK